jgi:hypothetical protein
VISLGGSGSAEGYTADKAVINLGNTTINGPVKKVPGTLTASGAAVVLGSDKITGKEPGASLTLGGDIIASSAEDSTNVSTIDITTSLSLSQVSLDLSVGAGLSFGRHSVYLSEGAKIILNTGTGVAPDGERLIDPRNSEDYYGFDANGGAPELLGSTAATKATIISIGHKIGGPVIIDGDGKSSTGDIVLRKGDTLIDPAKIQQ